MSTFENQTDLQLVPEAYPAEYEEYLENEEVPLSAIPPRQQEIPRKLKQEASLGNLQQARILHRKSPPRDLEESKINDMKTQEAILTE